MQNKMTASCSNGKIAIEHDNRVRISKNIDPGLSINNEYLVKCESLRQAYHKIFDDAVDQYNSKQKRKDRKIDDYYDKISKSKNGEKIAYEYVLQIGSHDTNPTGGEYQDVSKEIYREWLNEFMENNSNFLVINAAIHCDEPNGTPHMHITVVPVAHYEKGLGLRNSLSGAMREMGYKEPVEWCLDVQKQLGEKIAERGLEYVQLGTHRQHIENGLYQELKDKAVSQINKEIESTHAELAHLQSEKSELSDDVEELETKVSTLNEEIVEKQGFIARLESKVSEWISKFKAAVKTFTSEILVQNMKTRIENVLKEMPAQFINEFKERWNSYEEEFPCFELQYELPEKEKIVSPCYEIWEQYYYGKLGIYSASDRLDSKLMELGFTAPESHRIVVAMNLSFPSRGDFDYAMDGAYKIALENHKKRVKATPIDLKEKYMKSVNGNVAKKKKKLELSGR